MSSPTVAIGRVNWLGVWTLYVKEIQRFRKIILQTVIAPSVSALLFLTVFSLALGGALRTVGDIPYLQFLAPGLIMMALFQNSFQNSMASLIVAKVQGNIVDYLMPPLSAAELTIAIAMGGVTRGIVVGCAVAVAMFPFAPLGVHHVGAIIFYGITGSLMLSSIGVIAGIWAERFDQTAVITNFVVTPMTFLSGTFYSIDRLPGIWHTLSELNPFFYAIDGFRYGFIGVSDGSLVMGVIILIGVDLVLLLTCYLLFATGFRLKT
tara:strand:+ start:679 stop:1470 length:792 start_codon:yes stop_codon:yes gene_type:complete